MPLEIAGPGASRFIRKQSTPPDNIRQDQIRPVLSFFWTERLAQSRPRRNISPGAALGEATLAIVGQDGPIEAGSMQVDEVASALFMVSGRSYGEVVNMRINGVAANSAGLRIH